MEVIWGALRKEETAGESTGCCRDLLEIEAFGMGGVLWTLLSFSGSDSLSLEEVSGSVETTGKEGITDYY